MLKTLIRSLITVGVVICSVNAFAGNSTITYSTPQSTAIQNRLIPDYNAAHCRRFGLAPSCTSANLVTAGCVVRTFGPPAVAVTIESCTIFTSNAAGEQSFLQEVLNQKLADVFTQRQSSDESARDAAYSAANQTARDGVCTALSLAAAVCQ